MQGRRIYIILGEPARLLEKSGGRDRQAVPVAALPGASRPPVLPW